MQIAKKLVFWALFLLLFSLGVAQWVNGDLSRRWMTEAEYNQSLKSRSAESHLQPNMPTQMPLDEAK